MKIDETLNEEIKTNSITAKDILKLGIEEVQMLFSPGLQKKGIAVLCGGSDVGKTFFCLDMAISLCEAKLESQCFKISKTHGSVIMVCTEDTEEDICVRLTSFVKGRHVDLEKCRFIFDSTNLIEKLKQELKKLPADLIIIDTFGDLCEGHINHSLDIRNFLKPYKNIAKEFNCLILFTHHMGKGKEDFDTPNKSNVLGSGGIEQASRGVLILKKRDDSKRVLTIVKGNNIPDGVKNCGIVLSFDTKKGFIPTGEKISYSCSNISIKSQEDDEIKNLIKELYPKLKSYEKVSKELKQQGYKIGKTKIGIIWKKENPSVQNI